MSAREDCDMKFHLYFYKNGKRWGYRAWGFLPRVGDEVILGPVTEEAAYRITRVVLGTKQADPPHRHTVNLEIELVA